MVGYRKLLIAKLRHKQFEASFGRSRKLLDQLEMQLEELEAGAAETSSPSWCSSAVPAFGRMPRRIFALVGRPRPLRRLGRLRLQMLARGVQLNLEGLPLDIFVNYRLIIGPVGRIGDLGLPDRRRDVAAQLLLQYLPSIVAHQAQFRCAGIDLGALDRDLARRGFCQILRQDWRSLAQGGSHMVSLVVRMLGLTG